MTKAEFKNLVNFSLDERDYKGREITQRLSQISHELMLRADTMVTLAKEILCKVNGQFIIHDINYAGGHTDKSLHSVGMALDGHFRGIVVYHLIPVLLAFKAGITGIGWYPWWKHPGLHIDVRAVEYPVTWISPAEGQYKYDYEQLLFPV
jgi:uncharacterized protein YcbK (DUF882 family)